MANDPETSRDAGDDLNETATSADVASASILRPHAPTRKIQISQLSVAIIGVVVTVVLFWLGNRWLDARAEKAAARTQANVSIQGGVQPNDSRVVGGKLEPIRWRAWFFVVNYGPATATQFIVNIRTASPRRAITGNFNIAVQPTAAEVSIVPRSSGLHQVVVKNLQPGDGFWIEMLIMPQDAEVEAVNKLWPKQMFSEQLTAHFIDTVDAVGENVNISIDGIYKFGSLRDY
ncbi:MAG TPA: hypothetical protein VGF28_14265 [Thermoanaerobaculia bacterium]